MTLRARLARFALRTLLAAVVLVSAGCAPGDSDSPAATVAPPAPSTSAVSSGPTARQAVDAFAAAGLPVPNPRDNTRGNCPKLGCVQLVTTDAVSVYQWPDEASAQHQVDAWPSEYHRAGSLVLSYGAARTPQAERPRYEQALARLAPAR